MAGADELADANMSEDLDRLVPGRAWRYADRCGDRGAPADWIACQEEPLPVVDALAWAVLPRCTGARGTHYEAHRALVAPRLVDVAAVRCPSPLGRAGRVAMVHRLDRLDRLGALSVAEASVLLVVVVVSVPAVAFDAARFCMYTVKSSVPIWERETWDGGGARGLRTQPVALVDSAILPTGTAVGRAVGGLT